MIILNKKWIIAFCLMLSLVLMLTGCSTERKISSISENVKFIELSPKSQPDICYSEWMPIEEEDVVNDANLIFKGKILNKKEYAIEEAVSDEFTRTIYKTVYSVKVKDIYYTDNDDIKSGDKIELMSPVSSYNWETVASEIEDDKEYIFFANLTKDNETIKFTKLAKYCIRNPWKPIIKADNETFEMDEVFESLSQNSTIVNKKIDGDSKKSFIRKDGNFVKDLKDMIGKYKNKK